MKKLFITLSILFVMGASTQQTLAVQPLDKLINPTKAIPSQTQRDHEVSKDNTELNNSEEKNLHNSTLIPSTSAAESQEEVDTEDPTTTPNSPTETVLQDNTPIIPNTPGSYSEPSYTDTNTVEDETVNQPSNTEEQSSNLADSVNTSEKESSPSYPHVTSVTSETTPSLYKSNVLSRERTTSLLGLALLATLLGTILLIPPIPQLSWSKIKRIYSTNSQPRSKVIVEFPTSNY